MDFASILVPQIGCSWMHPRPFEGGKPPPYRLVARLLHSYCPSVGFRAFCVRFGMIWEICLCSGR